MKKNLRAVGTSNLKSPHQTERRQHVGAVEKTRTGETSVPIDTKHSAANATQGGTLTEHVQGEELVKRDRGLPRQREQRKKQAGIARKTGPAHPEQHRLVDQQMIVADST